MRIDYLKYFLDLSKTLSISKTATHNFMSQQGLSRAIRCLENELDIKLIEQIGNRIVLTPSGKELLQYIQKITDAYDELNMHILSRKKKYDNNYTRLYVSPYVINNIFPLLSRDLFGKFGADNLEIIEIDQYCLLDDFDQQSENCINLISLSGDILKKVHEQNDISYEPLLQAPLMIKLSADSPYKTKKYFTRKELKELPLAYDNAKMLQKSMNSYLGGDENVIMKIANQDVLDTLILENKAIGITTYFNYVYNMPTAMHCVPIKDIYSLEIGFIQNKKIFLSDFAVKIKNFIQIYCLKNFGLCSVAKTFSNF